MQWDVCVYTTTRESRDDIQDAVGGTEIGTGYSFQDGLYDIQHRFDNLAEALDAVTWLCRSEVVSAEVQRIELERVVDD